MRSAAVLNDWMMPRSSITIMPSGTVSRIDRRWASCPGCVVLLIVDSYQVARRAPRACCRCRLCYLGAMGEMIFIVDDDQAVRHSLTLLLASEGLAARGFASAREFLEA